MCYMISYKQRAREKIARRPAREVEAADGRGLLDQGDREVVVHKDLHDVAWKGTSKT